MKVEIKGLCKKFGSTTLFNDLNLTIEENKINCLYGKSGCGKTTILNIIGLIEPYDKGSVNYNGRVLKSIYEKRKFLREKIGFIFQDFGLLENETVYENMKLVYKIQKMKNSKQKIENLLHEFQLDGMIDRKVFGLSGGEQQRIAIAKTILKDPDLILADEPTASLDPENKKIVLQMLRNFTKLGKTVIIVSHDSDILEFSDISIDLSKSV